MRNLIAQGLLLASVTSPAVAQSISTGATPAPIPQTIEAAAGEQNSSRDVTNRTDDIVVTARRRGEDSLAVPVVVTAYSAEQLARSGVTNLTDIGRLTPQLQIEQNVGSYGGNAVLRGVSSPTSSVSADPAILIVVDSVPISVGAANRLGLFDLGQVEVLKGPQALFFGKNSSGGIISLRSADPTAETTAMIRGEYEVNARELELNGFISGSLTDTVKVRVAAKGLVQRGYVFNEAPNVRHKWGPGTREFGARGTLVFEPDSKLTIKLKASYDKVRDRGTYFISERIYCPSGRPSGPAASPLITDCSPNNRQARGDLPANVATATNDPLFRDGVPYSRFRQFLGVADVSYDFGGATLNSITGYYDLSQAYADSIVRGPFPINMASGSDKKHTISQELRLSSDVPNARFSWMVGGFFQDDSLYDTEHVVGYTPATGAFLNRPRSKWHIDSNAYSAFAQASWEIVPRLTLSGGARYTKEERKQRSNISDKFIPKTKFSNTSPELTLSYRPDQNSNFFVAYKQGYKSGNFQTSSLNFAGLAANPAVTSIDNSYGAERVSGVEGGIKAALFDRSLRVDFAAYSYFYKGLQLSRFDPATIITRILNVSGARVKGVELNLSYVPPSIPGLRLFGAVARNSARYRDFQGACFVGQTIAQGCTIDGPDAGLTPDLQDFTGRVLPRAPKWAGNVGFSIDHNVSDHLRVGLNAEGLYQSKQFISQESAPWGIRPDTFLLSAGINVGSRRGGWELALIGKNLTNKIYGVQGTQEQGTGVGASTGTAIGFPADYTAIAVARGREVRIRLTIRPGEL